MYNPYEYQNDLTRSQSEVGSLISGRAEQLKTMQTPGILKKAEALKKKGQALQKGAQDVQSAIELGLGAPMGPVVAEKIINPVINKVLEKYPEIGRRIQQGKGIISDIKGRVQKIGGKLTENNPIRSIQDEIKSRVSGVQEGIESKVSDVQGRVSGIQEGIESKVSDVQGRVSGDGGETKGETVETTPEEQSPLEFMQENMGGFKLPPADGSTQAGRSVDRTMNNLKSQGSLQKDMTPEEQGDFDALIAPEATPATTVSTTVGEVAGDAGADVAVDTGLAAVASADAWNPIGWIIGAGLAIGGIAEAVGAVGDQAKATADQATADQVKLPQQAPVNFAGVTVAPVQNALARTQ